MISLRTAWLITISILVILNLEAGFSKDVPKRYLYSSECSINKNSSFHNLQNAKDILTNGTLIVGWNNKSPSSTIGGIEYPCEKNNYIVEYEVLRKKSQTPQTPQTPEFEKVATVTMKWSKDPFGKPGFPIIEAIVNPEAKDIEASFLLSEPRFETNLDRTKWEFKDYRLIEKNMINENTKGITKVNYSGSFGAIKIQSKPQNRHQNRLQNKPPQKILTNDYKNDTLFPLFPLYLVHKK
jgi:hypothetical protein